MEIRAVRPDDAPALEAFLRRIPEGDRTFFKEHVEDLRVVAGWAQDGEDGHRHHDRRLRSRDPRGD